MSGRFQLMGPDDRSSGNRFPSWGNETRSLRCAWQCSSQMQNPAKQTVGLVVAIVVRQTGRRELEVRVAGRAVTGQARRLVIVVVQRRRTDVGRKVNGQCDQGNQWAADKKLHRVHEPGQCITKLYAK